MLFVGSVERGEWAINEYEQGENCVMEDNRLICSWISSALLFILISTYHDRQGTAPQLLEPSGTDEALCLKAQIVFDGGQAGRQMKQGKVEKY